MRLTRDIWVFFSKMRSTFVLNYVFLMICKSCLCILYIFYTVCLVHCLQWECCILSLQPRLFPWLSIMSLFAQYWMHISVFCSSSGNQKLVSNTTEDVKLDSNMCLLKPIKGFRSEQNSIIDSGTCILWFVIFGFGSGIRRFMEEERNPDISHRRSEQESEMERMSCYTLDISIRTHRNPCFVKCSIKPFW